jgi:hypothetical protein
VNARRLLPANGPLARDRRPDRRLSTTEAKMNASKRSRNILLAVGTAAAVLSFGVQAQSRCDAPPTQADQRACQMARAGRLDDLRRFIQRTQTIYGLYFHDYV